jgi:opacity protein-like surface antigen
MRTHSISVWIVSCVLAALPAAAQDYARNGFYIGAGAVGGIYLDVDEEVEDTFMVPFDVDADEAIGFEVFGGYRLHRHFAVEGEFEMLTESEFEAMGIDFAEIESWNLTGNVKAFPFTGRVQPFLLAGVGIMDTEVEDTVGVGFNESATEFAARFGAGVDVYLTENVVLYAGANYLLPTGDLDEVDYVSFGGGLQFRF